MVSAAESTPCPALDLGYAPPISRVVIPSEVPRAFAHPARFAGAGRSPRDLLFLFGKDFFAPACVVARSSFAE